MALAQHHLGGNLTPHNVDNVVREYPCVHTFTVQSAFRYDYPEGEVINAISKLNNRKPDDNCDVPNHGVLINVINKYVVNYQREIEGLANVINRVSNYVPRRRARKLHIGLFGYSRGGFRGGVVLPRAITFVAALYSLGIPPEVLGVSTINELSDREYSALSEAYVNLRHDLSMAARYVCHECLDMLTKLGNSFGITGGGH